MKGKPVEQHEVDLMLEMYDSEEYTIKEIAEHLGRAPATIRRYFMEAGRKNRRIGSLINLSRYRLRRWMTALGRDDVELVIDEIADALDSKGKGENHGEKNQA